MYIYLVDSSFILDFSSVSFVLCVLMKSSTKELFIIVADIIMSQINNVYHILP